MSTSGRAWEGGTGKDHILVAKSDNQRIIICCTYIPQCSIAQSTVRLGAASVSAGEGQCEQDFSSQENDKTNRGLIV